MKIEEIAQIVNGDIKVLCHELNFEVDSACGADLMSDVMAFSKENAVLITGLMNLQVLRTSEMMDIKVVLFIRGKEPTEMVLNLAKELGITIICTKELMFSTCGKLYAKGLKGGILND